MYTPHFALPSLRQILHGILWPILFLLQLIQFSLFLFGKHDLSLQEFPFRGSVYTKAFSRGHFNHLNSPVFTTSWSHLLFYFLQSLFQLTPRGGRDENTGFVPSSKPSFWFSCFLPASGNIFSSPWLCTEASFLA